MLILISSVEKARSFLIAQCLQSDDEAKYIVLTNTFRETKLLEDLIYSQFKIQSITKALKYCPSKTIETDRIIQKYGKKEILYLPANLEKIRGLRANATIVLITESLSRKIIHQFIDQYPIYMGDFYDCVH